MTSASTLLASVPASEVYRTIRVAALCDSNADCTVLELDRPVTNHTILPTRRAGAPTTADSVYVLGYPFVLPLKYDGPAPLFRVVDGDLISQLDIMGGNSGSPIFNAATNVVEGTLNGFSSSGITDLDFNGACNVEHQAQPADNYFSTGWAATLYASGVPPFVFQFARRMGWLRCQRLRGVPARHHDIRPLFAPSPQLCPQHHLCRFELDLQRSMPFSHRRRQLEGQRRGHGHRASH